MVMFCSPGDALSEVKLGILNFTAACQIAPAECILPYLVAAADPVDPVAQRGEELLKKRCFSHWFTWPQAHRSPCLLADSSLLQFLANIILCHAACSCVMAATIFY